MTNMNKYGNLIKELSQTIGARGFTGGGGDCHSKQGKTAAIIESSKKNVANNYEPIPVVISRGHGVHLYDVEGKKYLDFLSGHATLALGHCHPKIAKVIAHQSRKLTLTSRGLYTEALAEYAEYITKLFCYDKVLPANTGVDACETAVKLARKWGYKVKCIPSNEAKVIFAENNFWGRSIAAVSSSTDPQSYENYGPYVPGFETVPFNNTDCLCEKLSDPKVCAFMIEPIQGEAGVVLPHPGYLRRIRELCTEFNVLLIADEVQCGLGRAGSITCCEQFCIKPDILVLGKALSGGFMPVSAVLADKNIMDVIEPNTHGSTFGGNPLGCAVAMAVLKLMVQEKLWENSEEMGCLFRRNLCDLPEEVVCGVRGKGLFNAIVVNEGINTWDVCIKLMANGLIAKPGRNQTIRLTPPLNIKECDILKAVDIIKNSVQSFVKVKPVERPASCFRHKCTTRMRRGIKAIKQARKFHPFIRSPESPHLEKACRAYGVWRHQI